MSAKIFLDTNTLIYLYSTDAPLKKLAITNIIDNAQDILISTQTLNEFINVMSKKKKIPFSDLALVVNEFSTNFSIVQVTLQTIDLALNIAEKYRYSYFDSLILASALEHDCSIVYTEDMHHQQLIENKLLIHNPFSLDS
jgi:predicted nucleic acid-binding protein